MLYWKEYKGHKPVIRGKRNTYDANIYSFDIETSSYLVLDGKQISSNEYLNLSKKDRENCEYRSNMYIWMFGVNDKVYYGRSWDELRLFLNRLEGLIPERKYVFIHNLSFEFQYLKSQFHFKDVTARKAHKVMTAQMADYNIMLKCSYMMSNCALDALPKVFGLPVEKKVGDLDYFKIRNSLTPLTDEEMGYCENDILVLYHYIKRELETYEDVKYLPTTSTGKVRRELLEITRTDYRYRRKVYKAINTDPHIYNLLVDSFMGGYTHANWIYTDDVLENIDSFDEVSAYPYVLVTSKFPSTAFKRCYIKSKDEILNKFAYLLVVKFKNVKCKYFNNFISSSKCRNIKGARYDNGRIIEAKEFEMTITDIDFKFILDTYICDYEILESYYSIYNYLPKKFIEFVLEKYRLKTAYKNVEDKEIEYQKEKNKFNALYGMSVTNTIRDNVVYKDESEEWFEEELTNDEIESKLLQEKKKSFLSFAYGVWTTAYARDNLLRRVIELDDHIVYCDTDSLKLLDGYDKSVIEEYNKSVEQKIEFVSDILNIPKINFAPLDKFGESHMLGIFENETKKGHTHTYDEFITQGAKKYAYKLDDKIKITVAGVPKKGGNSLNSLDEFRDDYVFDYKDTGKKLLMYCEKQTPFELVDYLGNKEIVKDRSGCCILPTTYVLSKALDYANLITDESSRRAIYKEVYNE